MGDAPARGGFLRRWRILLPAGLALSLVVPLAVLWWGSLVPDPLSVMAMGEADLGRGRPLGHQHGDHSGRDVTTLIADPDRAPDVRVELRTDAATLTIDGRELPGFTVNGQSPGPTIRARAGELVEVTLRNGSVPDGVALHWHGVEVPNAMDGVAGVTQDAVLPGQAFTYRFVAPRPGTFWYHSHQVSHQQVVGGLLGALVIDPADPGEPLPEVVAVAHTYAGIRTVNGSTGDLPVPAAPGEQVRLRVVNTDNATLPLWSADPIVLAAVDGNQVHQPAPFADRKLAVAAGGRADLLVTVPASGSTRVQLSKATAVVVGDGPALPVPAQPDGWLDLLSYGEPVPSEPPPSVDRHFDYLLTQQPGFVRGRPGVWWAINGRLYPHVPMFVVAEGEVVGMRLVNDTAEPHPMHLHGHRVLVTARDGVAASGSPWWTDSLDIDPGHSFEVVFTADNPGIWMDHCHNLEHARDGMIAHLVYEGITTGFRLGGPAGNEPE